MKVFVSGIHSGPDPSSGVGVGRSIRCSYPEANLVGVDYSPGSSGIHCEVFNDVWVQRPWNELDLDLYRDQIAAELAGGAFWISCLDLETRWLAKHFRDEPRMLTPSTLALYMVAKPSILAAKRLPLSVPEYVLSDRPAWDLYAFSRRQGWPIWCKGPIHEARLVWTWADAQRALSDLQAKWPAGRPALQAHIPGNEESIVFSAYQGRLLDCLRMQKRAQTAEGKTWAGHVEDPPAFIVEPLRNALAALGWTGGGELELVRDDRDNLHLIDWNPRFPAWIFGATLTGRNLPARLVEAAGAGRPVETPCLGRQFSRVVMEVPVRSGYPLPPPLPAGAAAAVMPVSKHPSGMVQLAKIMRGKANDLSGPAAAIPASVLDDLSQARVWRESTPFRIFLEKTAGEVFRRTRDIQDSATTDGISVHVAYSIKTNPLPALMKLAKENGFLAEAITGHEFRHAIACGFAPEQIVLNGPAQAWPGTGVTQDALYAAFADSLERLNAMLEMGLNSRFLGIRLRPATAGSRFGVSLSEFRDYSVLTGVIRRLNGRPLGVHFHIQSDIIGVKPWVQTYEAMLRWACALQDSTGRRICCVDIGGGWFPDDFIEYLAPRLGEFVAAARQSAPALESFILEPGKALAQQSMALLTRVIEVRHPLREDGHTEAVMDAAVSDLPMAPYFPHRMLILHRSGDTAALAGGNDRVLGRNCMEFDVLAAGVKIPSRLAVGDMLVFGDAGAYDASMSYEFGTGRTTHV